MRMPSNSNPQDVDSGDKKRIFFFRRMARRTLPPAAWSRATRQLSAGLILIAMFGSIPTLVAWRSSDGIADLPLWAIGLSLLGVLQIVYTVNLTILPDSATLLVTAVFSLLISAGYAMLLAVRLLVSDSHPWMRFLQLDVNQHDMQQEAGWCFVMLLLTGMWSYFAGRAANQWRQWNRGK